MGENHVWSYSEVYSEGFFKSAPLAKQFQNTPKNLCKSLFSKSTVLKRFSI